jgi:hypothetical protein
MMTMTTVNPTPTQKFDLGTVVMTCGVASFLEALGEPTAIIAMLHRHMTGDWGDICREDRQSNEDGLLNGDRLLSVYTVDGEKLWVITESDRSVTTVLLPDEY